jgi:hypothetical protein
MKNIKYKLLYLTRLQNRQLINEQTLNQVERQVYNQISYQVWEQVFLQTCNLIWDQIDEVKS